MSSKTRPEETKNPNPKPVSLARKRTLDPSKLLPNPSGSQTKPEPPPALNLKEKPLYTSIVLGQDQSQIGESISAESSSDGEISEEDPSQTPSLPDEPTPIVPDQPDESGRDLTIQDGQFVSIDVFKAHIDIGQTYKLEKCILYQTDKLEVELFHKLPKKNIEVLGVCGYSPICRTVISEYLGVSYEKISEEEECNNIRAYFVTGSPRLCLFFQSKNKTLFTRGPYRSNSKENIYFRLLLDLCSAVVVCPGGSTKNTWYRPNSTEPSHPFVEQLFCSEDVVFQTKTVTTSKLEEISDAAFHEQKITVQSGPETTVAAEEQMSGPQYKPIMKYIRDSTEDELAEAAREEEKVDIDPAKDSKVPKVVLSKDHFPYVYQKTAKKFNKKMIDESAKETLGFLIRDLIYFIMKNGVIEDRHWKNFSGLSSFKAIIKEYYENEDDIINTFKSQAQLASQSLQTEVFPQFVDKLISRLEALFCVPRGCLDEAKEQILSKMKAQSEFADLCLTHFKLDYIFGIYVHGRELAQHSHSIESNLESEIRLTARSLYKKCLDKLQHNFWTIHYSITKKLTIKSEKLGSYTVKLECFTLNLLFTGFTISEDTHTKEHICPGDPHTTELHTLDENIAFVMYSGEGFYKVFKFNPDQNSRDENYNENDVETKVKIVSGSISRCFVAIKESKKDAYYGQVAMGKYITFGNQLNLYTPEVVEIRDACFLPEKRVLYLLNQEGNLYSLDLKQPETGVQRVLNSEGTPVESRMAKDDFTHIRCSSDEKVFIFLSTKNALQAFSSTFNFLALIKLGKSAKIASYKIVSRDYHRYIIAKLDQPASTAPLSTHIKVYHFEEMGEHSIPSNSETSRDEIKGNPIVDGFVYALKTFGFYEAQNNGEKSLTDKSFFIYINEDDDQSPFSDLDNYPKSIPHLRRYFSHIGIAVNSMLPKLKLNGISAEEFMWKVGSRQPIHVCSIQEGKLIPLKNGKIDISGFNRRISQEKDYIKEYLEYMQLGFTEKLLEKEENPIVVSIMGKQSSGKSYLLNRIFDTRFDVSSNRCTDGIWMSLCKKGEKVVVVLDCEGLFSVERTEQEEIMLCLFIAAISDVTILNSDLSMGKHLSGLLEKFERAMNRLSGEKLFKGKLDIVMRDVFESDGAYEDLQHVIHKMSLQGRSNFMGTLFSDRVSVVSMHYFESEEFEAEVQELRQDYFSLRPHWKSGEEFLRCMKAVLAQINFGDKKSLEEGLIDVKLSQAEEMLNDALKTGEDIVSLLKDGDTEVKVPIDGPNIKFEVKFSLKQVKMNESNFIGQIERILRQASPPIMEKYHNEFYRALSTVAKEFIKTVKSRFEDQFFSMIPSTEATLSKAREDFKRRVFSHLAEYEKKNTLCLKICEKCRLCCTLLDHETNVLHSCKTNHKCKEQCAQCQSSCAGQAAHDGPHDCKKRHKCKLQCELCQENCQFDEGHAGSHNCILTRHPCKIDCAVCHQKCSGILENPHSSHVCNMVVCGVPCYSPGCIEVCAVPDHLHSLKAPKKPKMHSCSQHATTPSIGLARKKK